MADVQIETGVLPKPAPTFGYRWIVLLEHGGGGLRQLLRLRLHRPARPGPEPAAPLLRFPDRPAPGRLQPPEHRRDARVRRPHRPDGNAEVDDALQRPGLHRPGHHRPQPADRRDGERPAHRGNRRRGVRARVQRRDRPLVLARRAEPGPRQPQLVPPSRFVHRADVAGVGRRRLRLLALAAADGVRLRRVVPGRLGLYWMLDARGRAPVRAGARGARRAGRGARHLPLQPLVLAHRASLRHLLRLHLPVPDVRPEVPDRVAQRLPADRLAADRDGAAVLDARDAAVRLARRPLRAPLAADDVRVAADRPRLT